MSISKVVCTYGSIGALILISLPYSSYAQDEEQQNDRLEEVVVVGIKASLERALEIKRNAAGIVDAISSQELGAFPDENLAESLQRISGVTIQRQRGEGTRVSIRGLGPNLNLTLINGQQISSSNLFEDEQPSRGFNYALLASEVISSAEVYKSPEAWFDEGGVGGTVILRTLRPLDLNKPLLNLRLEAGHSQLADEVDPRLSFTATAKTKDERWGGIISFARTERSIRNDGTGPLSFSPTPIDLNSDGILDYGTVPANTNSSAFGAGDLPDQSILIQGIDDVDENGNPVVRGIISPDGLFQPDLLANTFFSSLRERTGGSGTIQYRPSDQWEFALNGIYSELTEEGVNNNFLLLPGRPRVTVTPINDAVIVNNTLVAGTIPETRITDGANFTGRRAQEFNTALDSFDRDAKIDTYAVDLEAAWTPSDQWKVITHLGATEATTDSTNRFTETVTFGSQSFDLRVGENGSQSVSNDLLNPDGQFIGFANFSTLEQEQKQTYVGTDVQYYFEDAGALKSLRFGAKYRDQSQDRREVSSRLVPNANGDSPFAFTIGDFNPQPTPSDFLTGGFEDGIRSFLFTDPAAVDALFGAGHTEGSIFVPVPNNRTFFDIEEEILSAFVQINFDTENGVRGNVGLRAIRTDRQSNALTIQGPTVTPFTQQDDSSEVLPSVNLAFDLTDELVFRAAAARTMSLPTFSDLSPTRVIIEETRTANTGNPDLEAFIADQLDLSLEYYFGERNGISLGLFYKDIQSFVFRNTVNEVIDGNEFRVTRPENGQGGDVSGVEFAYLHNFDFLPAPFDGLGAQFNYTYSDSKTSTVDPQSGTSLGLPGQSEHTGNVSLFYDKKKFSSRLAYAYRSDFFARISNANAVIIDDTYQVDWNINYRITEKASVFVEAINLTDEHTPDAHAGSPERILGQGRFGRRYFIGASYTF